MNRKHILSWSRLKVLFYFEIPSHFLSVQSLISACFTALIAFTCTSPFKSSSPNTHHFSDCWFCLPPSVTLQPFIPALMTTGSCFCLPLVGLVSSALIVGFWTSLLPGLSSLPFAQHQLCLSLWTWVASDFIFVCWTFLACEFWTLWDEFWWIFLKRIWLCLCFFSVILVKAWFSFTCHSGDPVSGAEIGGSHLAHSPAPPYWDNNSPIDYSLCVLLLPPTGVVFFPFTINPLKSSSVLRLLFWIQLSQILTIYYIKHVCQLIW